MHHPDKAGQCLAMRATPTARVGVRKSDHRGMSASIPWALRPQTSGCHLPRRAILRGMKTEKKKARKPVKASKTAPKKAGAGAKKSAAPKFAPRADFGAPID